MADHPPHKIEFIFFNIKKKPFHTHSVLVSQAYDDLFVAEIMSVQTSKDQSLWHKSLTNIVKTQDSKTQKTMSWDSNMPQPLPYDGGCLSEGERLKSTLKL